MPHWAPSHSRGTGKARGPVRLAKTTPGEAGQASPLLMSTVQTLALAHPDLLPPTPSAFQLLASGSKAQAITSPCLAKDPLSGH